MAVVKTHESVRSCRWIEPEERLEFLESLGHFADSEVAFPQRGVHVGAPRVYFYGFRELRNGVFVERLLHAQSGHKQESVRIFRGQLLGAHEKFEIFYISPLWSLMERARR